MNDPHSPPVTVTEIAELTAQLRTLSPPRHGQATARAAFLAAKADLLARIADQHARDWPCQHATQARQIAAEARVVAGHARTLIHPVDVDAEDDTP